MVKKFTIGLIYSVNENWIAGTYYIENLINALGSLPEIEQPFLKIYCYSEEEYKQLLSRVFYKNMETVFIKEITSFSKRLINKISLLLFRKYFITGLKDSDVDIVFPNPVTYHFSKIKKKLFWIPDFQEKHYPGFFTEQQILLRLQQYRFFVEREVPIVFSSLHAKADFVELFPEAKNKLFVMPFAVTLPEVQGIELELLKKKYDLPDGYFICSNQFWKHKNHQVILNAVKSLKERGIIATIVFTGKSFDNRNPDFYEKLVDFVERNELTDLVKFLGFIPREDQLVLMKGSHAIIQPSLFEGWSTVVEDAKALNKRIITSDIPVHREQLINQTLFFQPNDSFVLAQYMQDVLSLEELAIEYNYQNDIRDFGRNFISIALSC